MFTSFLSKQQKEPNHIFSSNEIATSGGIYLPTPGIYARRNSSSYDFYEKDVDNKWSVITTHTTTFALFNTVFGNTYMVLPTDEQQYVWNSSTKSWDLVGSVTNGVGSYAVFESDLYVRKEVAGNLVYTVRLDPNGTTWHTETTLDISTDHPNYNDSFSEIYLSGDYLMVSTPTNIPSNKLARITIYQFNRTLGQWDLVVSYTDSNVFWPVDFDYPHIAVTYADPAIPDNVAAANPAILEISGAVISLDSGFDYLSIRYLYDDDGINCVVLKDGKLMVPLANAHIGYDYWYLRIYEYDINTGNWTGIKDSQPYYKYGSVRIIYTADFDPSDNTTFAVHETNNVNSSTGILTYTFSDYA